MAVQGDEVAERIEQQIREAIDRLVEELRTSVQDVREAVDQQLEAAVQSVQADVKSLSFRHTIGPILSEALASAAEAAPFPEAPAVAPASAKGPDASLLRKAVRAVESGKSQVEILNALLEQSLNFASRSALLILKGESFAGWKGVGFSSFTGDDEAVKRLTVGPGAVAELDQLRTREHPVAWNGANLSSKLGVGSPHKAIAIPMVIKDKIAAVLYVDSMSDEARFDRASIETLVFVTGLLVDTLAIRKKIPSPTLSDDDGQIETGDVFSDMAGVAPAPAAPPPQSSFTGSDATVAVTPEILRQAQEAAAARVAEPAPPRPAPAPPAAPPPQAAPPPHPPAAPAPPAAEERPSTQYVPPPEVARAVSAVPSEEAKKHEDAKRFARLLVSEIKLYNEAKVDQGRKNRDLYERLKEDIDRSRQMFDERVPEEVRSVSNYFYDELVRILADGNSDALGL